MYCGYDITIGKGKPNITSLWGSTTPKEKLPKHFITISNEQKAEILKYPNHFRVEQGTLIAVKDKNQTDLARAKAKDFAKERSEARSKLLAPLEIDGRIYHLDNTLISNININLNIGTIYPHRETKLWCIVDDNWQFLDHSLEMLADILVAFDDRRIESSLNLHTIGN